MWSDFQWSNLLFKSCSSSKGHPSSPRADRNGLKEITKEAITMIENGLMSYESDGGDSEYDTMVSAMTSNFDTMLVYSEY